MLPNPEVSHDHGRTDFHIHPKPRAVGIGSDDLFGASQSMNAYKISFHACNIEDVVVLAHSITDVACQIPDNDELLHHRRQAIVGIELIGPVYDEEQKSREAKSAEWHRERFRQPTKPESLPNNFDQPTPAK